jgi:glutathione S-transferase
MRKEVCHLQADFSVIKTHRMTLPILYSFRRCPYAMRARMAIVRTGFEYEHREVVLKDKPAHMLQTSPKATVPVLLLPDGTMMEESLDIMQHVLKWELSENEVYWIKRNDEEFKYHLDRYKYPNRYENADSEQHRAEAANYLQDLDDQFFENETSTALNDALFPFIRQFANHDRTWFDAQAWTHIHQWLKTNLASEEFTTCMTKYPQWEAP